MSQFIELLYDLCVCMSKTLLDFLPVQTAKNQQYQVAQTKLSHNNKVVQ